MSEKEYKTKCENMFVKNTILINEYEQLKKDNKDLQTRYHIVPEHYLSEAIEKCNEYEKQIENYKLSENESKEIIAELKAQNEILQHEVQDIRSYCELVRDIKKQVLKLLEKLV